MTIVPVRDGDAGRSHVKVAAGTGVMGPRDGTPAAARGGVEDGQSAEPLRGRGLGLRRPALGPRESEFLLLKPQVGGAPGR